MAGLLFTTSCFGRGEDERPGSDMRVAILQPASLDPVRIRDAAGNLIARQVFAPLASFDPATNRLIPGAADWETHDGGGRFIFRLRDGLRFHNGRPVRAADVVFSLNRLAAKATGSDLAFLLSEVLGFEHVNQLGTASELEGVRAMDDSTVEIRLRAGWIDFPYVLTHPATAPVPMEEFLADPEGFRKKPIGAGPYAFTGPVEQGGDVFLESTSHTSTDLKIKKVSFLVYSSTFAAFRDFERQEVDVAEVPVDGPRSLATFEGTAGFKPVAAMLHAGFNLKHPKFENVRFREAISLAIDRANLAQIGYFNTLSPASGLVPKGLPGGGGACGDRCEQDVDRARVLIGEAFGGPAPSLTFDFPKSNRDEAAAELLSDALNQIGISVELRGHELTDYVGLLGSDSIEMFRLGWVAEYPLADWFMAPLFRSDSPDNRSGYGSQEVDGLISQARLEPDQATRDRLYRELEARLMVDMPVVPLGQFESRYAAGDVGGFYVDTLGTFEVRRMDGN